jgi:Conserved mid region of cactin
MLAGKDLNELLELQREIEGTLAADRSMAMELQYWSNVLKKIEERVAKSRIEGVF